MIIKHLLNSYSEMWYGVTSSPELILCGLTSSPELILCGATSSPELILACFPAAFPSIPPLLDGWPFG